MFFILKENLASGSDTAVAGDKILDDIDAEEQKIYNLRVRPKDPPRTSRITHYQIKTLIVFTI